MTTAFRLSLALLVLTNIVFVHITGAVGMNWLVPLYTLTLAAPFLTRFTRFVSYRVLWNMGVLAIFTTLLIDAQRTGIEYLLEDGLLLAAFCQVHLLNVLQRQHKPDLLFFNSFLIALVTSNFSQDISYSAVFVVYAVMFIATVQMSSLADEDHNVAPELLGLIWRDVFRKATAVLAVTTLVFLFWPRDFNREGIVSDDMTWSQTSAGLEFNDEVRLGRSAHKTLSNRVVMRLHLKQGLPQHVPSHWRGATMNTFLSSSTWISDNSHQPRNSKNRDSKWVPSRNRIERYKESVDATNSARVRVQFYSPKVRRLFAPLSAHVLFLEEPEDPSRAMPFSDGTVGYTTVRRLGDSELSLEYDALLATKREVSDPTHPPVTHYLSDIHPSGIPDSAHSCMRKALAGTDGFSQARRVEACRSYFANNYAYLLPGEQGAASNLEEFMSRTAGGHCEYFATSLAMLLYLDGVTCRLVTGYLAEEWDDTYRTITVRAKHAHAWIEVWDKDEGGWYTVDPSPSAVAADDSESIFAGLRQTIEHWWTSITQFDSESRAAALAWIVDTPRRISAAFADRPIRSTAILATILAMIYGLWRLVRKRLDPVSAAYRRALRRAGLARSPTETPREVLSRAQQMDPQPRRLAELAAATADHEQARFALLDR